MEGADVSSPDDVLGLLPAAVEGAAKRSLERRLLLERARKRALEREVAQVQREDPDEPAMVARWEAELSHIERIVDGIRSELPRIGTAEPAPDGTTVIRGRVLVEGAKGLPGATVTAFGPRGGPLTSSRTTEDGAFVLTISTPGARTEAILLGRARKKRASEAEAADAPSGDWPPLGVFLEVRDAAGGLVHRDSESRTFNRGEVHVANVSSRRPAPVAPGGREHADDPKRTNQ